MDEYLEIKKLVDRVITFCVIAGCSAEEQSGGWYDPDYLDGEKKPDTMSEYITIKTNLYYTSYRKYKTLNAWDGIYNLGIIRCLTEKRDNEKIKTMIEKVEWKLKNYKTINKYFPDVLTNIICSLV